MNEGLTPHELVAVVKLPPHLENYAPYLRQHYGTVSHSAREIYVGYPGWFQGDRVALARRALSMRILSGPRLMLIAVCLVLAATVASPQSDQGSVIGIISDGAARLVQGAPVEATNMDTGLHYKTKSGEVGVYRLTALPTGTYEVSVTLPQFEKFVQQRVKVEQLRAARVDIVLTPR